MRATAHAGRSRLNRPSGRCGRFMRQASTSKSPASTPGVLATNSAPLPPELRRYPLISRSSLCGSYRSATSRRRGSRRSLSPSRSATNCDGRSPTSTSSTRPAPGISIRRAPPAGRRLSGGSSSGRWGRGRSRYPRMPGAPAGFRSRWSGVSARHPTPSPV